MRTLLSVLGGIVLIVLMATFVVVGGAWVADGYRASIVRDTVAALQAERSKQP